MAKRNKPHAGKWAKKNKGASHPKISGGGNPPMQGGPSGVNKSKRKGNR